MNSRERVLAAIAHKEPPKVSVDMGSNPSSGISAIAYSDLIKYLGAMNGPFMDPDMYRQLFKPRHKQLCEFAKKNSNMRTFLHPADLFINLFLI